MRRTRAGGTSAGSATEVRLEPGDRTQHVDDVVAVERPLRPVSIS